MIDYDVIDYLEFDNYQKDGIDYVSVSAQVRIVTMKNGKIKSQILKDKYVMKRHNNGGLELNSGANVIKCHNCGASISATEGACNYCNTEIKYLQEWILVNDK